MFQDGRLAICLYDITLLAHISCIRRTDAGYSYTDVARRMCLCVGHTAAVIWAMQKWMNRLRWRLGCWFVWTQGNMANPTERSKNGGDACTATTMATCYVCIW